MILFSLRTCMDGLSSIWLIPLSATMCIFWQSTVACSRLEVRLVLLSAVLSVVVPLRGQWPAKGLRIGRKERYAKFVSVPFVIAIPISCHVHSLVAMNLIHVTGTYPHIECVAGELNAPYSELPRLLSCGLIQTIVLLSEQRPLAAVLFPRVVVRVNKRVRTSGTCVCLFTTL